MARQIDDRLGRLRQRRFDDSLPMMQEQYEKRSTNKATRYALGAMQQVDPRSTQISHEEFEKVERNLLEGLDKEGLQPKVRFQGSVPLNVHTRGVSDVDLLVIEGLYLRIEPCEGGQKSYLPYTGKGSLCDDVLFLRKKSKEVLDRRFWGAKVDGSPAKSIQLTEGGFRRKVDVVPSHWYDTATYQMTLNDTYRGIDVVDQYTRESFRNYPFLYMDKINSKDRETLGGAKMSIRLAKNVRNDADGDIELSSYDIGSLMFHCPSEYITSLPARDLMVLSGTDRWFDELASDMSFAMSLDTPDGTRKIIDNVDRWTGLTKLSSELNALASEVEREIIGPFGTPSYDRGEIRKRLNDGQIPLLPDEFGLGARF
ncbi:hypothetical protein [Amaricoccus tamworthensis]|uniref:hypothetical protein n=1 Tax=Amaricoccus tamworthensis TaxID=57002 RepID=UPI003C798E0A